MTVSRGRERRFNENAEVCSRLRPVKKTDWTRLKKLGLEEALNQTKKGKKMPTMEIVKAWKDEDYRDTLTTEQRADLPEHPSGIIEFGQPQLEDESLFGPGARGCKFSSLYTRICTKLHGHCK